ncbi:hypothetical protein [Streptomyces achromogenes]|uniref:hypothetical protein n=1 Tax=Streptomyces achromogenes TaxID=67255 RepID=UPI003A80E303
MDEKSRRAIAHLAEALYLLSCVRDQDEQATVPIMIGENQVVVTPKTAEALADAVDSMNAYVDSESPIDGALRDLADGIRETVVASPGGVLGERIDSGEWSAAAVAQCDSDLWAQVKDVYAELNLRVLTKKVLDDAHADNLTVNRALDSFFGEIADPYADEDDV